ncbi:MAG: cohesin domain-containing protein [Patescibacteria group bacterium]
MQIIVYKTFLSFWALLLVIFSLVSPVFAVSSQASIFIVGPAQVEQGQVFSSSVFVSSAVSMNAVSATISYDSSMLDLVQVVKAPSIISLWVQEPELVPGSVRFSATILNPGYQGDGGQLVTLQFKPKNTGISTVSVTSGMILANDGLGTDITGPLGLYRFEVNPLAIKKPILEPEQKIPAENGLPSGGESDALSGPGVDIIQKAIQQLDLNNVPSVDIQKLTQALPVEYIFQDQRVKTTLAVVEQKVKQYQVATVTSVAVNTVSISFSVVYWVRLLRSRRLLASLAKKIANL